MSCGNPIVYPGGAWRKSKHILAYLPPVHSTERLDGMLSWIESFGGGASTLFRAPEMNIPRHIAYNDLNGRLVNMFRQIRNEPNEFIDLIGCTLYHPEELVECVDIHEDPMEDARRFYTLLHLARRPFDDKPTFVRQYKCATKKGGKSPMTMRSARFHKLEHVICISERLRDASITQMDGIEHMLKHDGEHAFHLIDPPFNREMRKRGGLYAEELGSDPAYEQQLLATADSLAGWAIVLGYNSPVHEEVLWNWYRVDYKVNTDGSAHNESFWINPRLRCEYGL